MIEQIGLCALYGIWFTSIIGCFVIGVCLEEYKSLERYALPMIFIALFATIIMGSIMRSCFFLNT